MDRIFVLGNRQLWTLAFWFKPGLTSGLTQSIISDAAGTDPASIGFNASRLQIVRAGPANVTTTRVFRDPSAWYHVVIIWDTAQAVAAERVRVYVNGRREGAFDIEIYPGLNAVLGGFNFARLHTIGRLRSTQNRFDGALADFHFIDGQALGPENFGRFDPTTDVWTPIRYEGTYGVTGFRLEFQDGAALGQDSSGVGNDWTPSGLPPERQLLDTPTNNVAVIPSNLPLASSVVNTGNRTLDATSGSAAGLAWASQILSSRRWYFEARITGSPAVGTFGTYPGLGCIRLPWAQTSLSGGSLGYFPGQRAAEPDGFCIDMAGALNIDNTKTPGVTEPYVLGDVFQLALDLDSGQAWPGRNGVWQGPGNPDPVTGADAPITGLSGDYVPMGSVFLSNIVEFNFGQRPFAFAPPAGFQAIGTRNMPLPRITRPSRYFDGRTWVGDGVSPRVLVDDLEFAPDIVWPKSRSLARSHHFYDTVRGPADTLFPDSNSAPILNNAEGYLSAFRERGWEAVAGAVDFQDLNFLAATYAAWHWRRSPLAGVDIVEYVGNGGVQSIPHNLGAVPQCMIVKGISLDVNWAVYHEGIGLNPAFDPAVYMLFLDTGSIAFNEVDVWNATRPTDSVFTVGNSLYSNVAGNRYIAYLFRSVPGFSHFGGYVGNGIANGPMVPLDFQPRMFVAKKASASATATNWPMVDSIREGRSNELNLELYTDLPNAEFTNAPGYDFLSNGVKIRANDSWVNLSGNYFVYLAFADMPQNWSMAR